MIDEDGCICEYEDEWDECFCPDCDEDMIYCCNGEWYCDYCDNIWLDSYGIELEGLNDL